MPNIAFAHLDLGIGGAEMLVVNAALALKSKGHRVVIYTTQHSIDHCFAQTRGDGVLANDIVVAGSWLPRSFLGRGTAFFSSLRMVYLALFMLMRVSVEEVVFCDGVSTPLPLFSIRFPVMFYCHFPDKLLCTERRSSLKKLYRGFIDWVEEMTTGCADVIVVNSNFTRGIFRQAFPSLKVDPAVIYPVADLQSFTLPDWSLRTGAIGIGPFVSLNRFERKKNIGLAIEALSLLKTQVNPETAQQLQLIIAGGYDINVTENVEYLQELKALAKEFLVEDLVSFRPSISDSDRDTLLQSALCVIYTPENEHFGIVPIEAMYAGAPVLACKSGGPLETVRDGETGFLRENTPAAFSDVMFGLAMDPQNSCALGRVAHEHIKEHFGPERFADILDKAILSTVEKGRMPNRGRSLMTATFATVLIVFLSAMYVSVMKKGF